MNLENEFKNSQQRWLETSFKKRVAEINKNQVFRAYSHALKTVQQVSARVKRSFLTRTNVLKEKDTSDAVPTLDTLHQDSKSEKKIRYRSQTPAKNNSIGPGTKKPKKNHDFIKFETIKAKSDLLELKRDLATYELNFILSFQSHQQKQSLQNHFTLLSSKIVDFNLETVGTDLLKNLQKALKIPDPIKSNLPKLSFKQESFPVKHLKTHSKPEIFEGFIKISETLVLAKVQSSSLSNHVILFCLGTKTGRLVIEKALTEKSSEKYSLVLKKDLLRHCFLIHFQNEVSFGYDPLHSVTFSIISVKIKGLGLVSVRLEPEEEGVKVEVVRYNLRCFLEKEKIQSFWTEKKNFELFDISKISSFLQNFLVYYKKKLYFWEKSKIFESREENSYLLNEERLSQIFCNYFKQKAKFLLRVNGKQVSVTVLDSTGIKVSIKRREKAYLGPEHISFLEGLQSLSILKNPLTLSKSLELKHLIIKQLKL
jgi:hypothetical protein